ncbi:PQ-loop repeat-containing protein [Stenotrophomonas sp. PS02289]|uniref:PQ-loop repeat-containing protein n=1 Tax=Stenotrophomonas sp. PS02289 TaxID=2991422 RepID=UPI00249B2EAC|nr:PQ-loop repeat-containing protein [Stenotrophomonas sp. PS02289]
MSPDLLGWAATAVLIATLTRQIYKQHQAGSTDGVSTWLFVGQITASVLFIVYSALMGSLVFVVTNSLIFVTAVVGQVLAVRRRRSQTR